MNIWRTVLREYQLLRHHYLASRLRWLIWERKNPLCRNLFRLGDGEYSYFIHPYNVTWANERAVEIPVMIHLLEVSEPSSVLEIGNVMSHYFDSNHIVVDKHETCAYRHIINADIMGFDPQCKFSLIVSVSTIEHVGWDDLPRDETKVMFAFKKIRSLLEPCGKAVFTIPVGYNTFLDQQMRDDAIDGATYLCLKRVSVDNQWIETDLADALQCKYGSTFKYANAVVFLYLAGE